MQVKINTNYNISNNHLQKRSCPTFGGYLSKFSKRLDKVLTQKECSFNDSIFLQNSLEKIVAKRLKNNDVLGEGSMARVLKIDSKYVVRLSRWDNPVVTGFDEKYVDPYRDVKLKTYKGAYVAQFGDAQILENISPTGKQMPAGIPLQMTLHASKEDCKKYYEDVYLPTFAKLPQKVYDDVACDFEQLNMLNDGSWYIFDILNPNNFVLVGKKIKIVDKIAKISEDSHRMEGYDDKYIDKGMSTTDMMRVFLMNQDCLNECEFSQKSLPLRRELFKKLAIAGIKK